MANNLLKINRAEYEARIIQLKGYLNQLDTKITQYETLKANTDKFMSGNDDNCTALKESVETNINEVRTARRLTDDSIKMLQETLSNFEELQEGIKKNIQESVDLTKNTLKGAIEAIKLLD